MAAVVQTMACRQTDVKPLSESSNVWFADAHTRHSVSICSVICNISVIWYMSNRPLYKHNLKLGVLLTVLLVVASHLRYNWSLVNVGVFTYVISKRFVAGKLPSDKCQWAPLTTSQHGREWWLDAIWQQVICRSGVDPDLCCKIARLGQNELGI